MGTQAVPTTTERQVGCVRERTKYAHLLGSPRGTSHETIGAICRRRRGRREGDCCLERARSFSTCKQDGVMPFQVSEGTGTHGGMEEVNRMELVLFVGDEGNFVHARVEK